MKLSSGDMAKLQLERGEDEESSSVHGRLLRLAVIQEESRKETATESGQRSELETHSFTLAASGVLRAPRRAQSSLKGSRHFKDTATLIQERIWIPLSVQS